MILQIRRIDGKILNVFKDKPHCKNQLKITNHGFNDYRINTSPQGYYLSVIKGKQIKLLGIEEYRKLLLKIKI